MRRRLNIFFLIILSCAGILKAQQPSNTIGLKTDKAKVIGLDGQWELVGYSPDKFNHYKLQGSAMVKMVTTVQPGFPICRRN